MTAQRQAVLVTPEQLAALQAGPKPVTVLAVRSVSPYTGIPTLGTLRIPGAIDAEAYSDFAGPASVEGGQRPLPEIGTLQDAARRWGLDADSTIVVYDGDRSLTAARAWWVLKWAGLPDVRVLDGGFPAWVKAGLPTSSEPSVAKRSSIALTPGHMPEIGADGAVLLARSAVLLDARIRPNYIGGASGAGQPARGHIPGAISAPAPDNVTDYGNFTDSDTLREMYRGLGVDPGTVVGVYCGAGMSAAHTVLALAAIGVDASMYPGSWSAWVADPRRPVARGSSAG